MGSNSQGANRFFSRMHFLACEDIARGPTCQWGEHFFVKFRGPSGGSQLSGGGIIILRVQSTSDACRSLTTLTRPRREHQGGGRRGGLGRERHGGREDSTVVSHAEGSMTVRGFTGSSAVAGEEQQVWVSRGMARPAMGVRWGGEACAAAQPATGGGSRQSRWRLFERLEQEDHRLKKHNSHWMNIQQSLQLESFILTKLTKPLVLANLVGPQVSLQNGAPQISGGDHFLGGRS